MQLIWQITCSSFPSRWSVLKGERGVLIPQFPDTGRGCNPAVVTSSRLVGWRPRPVTDPAVGTEPVSDVGGHPRLQVRG